jgi:hypothetical protein
MSYPELLSRFHDFCSDFNGLLLLLIPCSGLMLSPLCCFAMFFAIAKDSVRLSRWRRESKGFCYSNSVSPAPSRKPSGGLPAHS